MHISLGVGVTNPCWWTCSSSQRNKLNIVLRFGHWAMSLLSCSSPSREGWRSHNQPLTLQLKLGPAALPKAIL